ncbi:MAG: response regulator [Synergistaceae bacterium]|jgi:CheY-like chemotaxis protein/nitrogen-specific signal transduction histidine kinase|nr:response regulator [Synergistaceae bacterium]
MFSELDQGHAIATLRDENKRLRRENEKLQRELRYERGINERNRVNAEAKTALGRVVSAEKSRLERYMDLMLANYPDMMLIFDRDGRLAYASNSYLRRNKIPVVGMIIGKKYSELMAVVLTDEFLIRAVEIFKTAHDGGVPADVEQNIDFDHDGGIRHYVVKMTPMIDSFGKVECVMVVFFDTTELTRTKLEAEKARELAEQSTRAKSDFLSRMSLEMRTPMIAIIGMTTIANSTGEPERKEYCLDKINEASTHLLGVINDILDMSKIEADKFELSFSEFNFEKMLQRVTNVINFRVAEMGQELLVKIDPGMPSRIFSDEQRLAQVITNLLSNAVKFTPERGAITLIARKVAVKGEECTIQIEVKDTGIGISEEQQNKLFDSFVQADGSISRKYGGTGLGLSISKRIVELMGGRIWIESKLGRGSSFIFEIRAESCADGNDAPLQPDAGMENINILVVDDSPEILEIFNLTLGSYGMRCETAALPGEALRLVKRSEGDPFDVIFVDWRMPEMNGVELAKLIKLETGYNQVVIMTSATDWNEIVDDARRSGLSRFLQKPLFPSAIFNCINECVLGAPQAAESTPVAGASVVNIFSRYKALVAEDVKINQEILSALLEDTGVTLHYADDGADAVEKFSSDPEGYDIVLMDVQMPTMDGCEATRRIRSSGLPRSKEIPIIAMTANVFREDVERCRASGMDDHIGKPIDMEEVITKLRKYMS